MTASTDERDTVVIPLPCLAGTSARPPAGAGAHGPEAFKSEPAGPRRRAIGIVLTGVEGLGRTWP
jgi:hypothetical protein